MQIAGRTGLGLAERPHETAITPDALRAYCLGEIFAYLSRRINRREDAEDLSLEVFLAAYQSVREIRPSEIRPWLFGIARRKLADHLRRKSRRPETLESETAGLGSVPGNEEPGDEYLKREAIQMLQRIVDSLPEDQRDALLMQHLEELSIHDISLAFERSPAAINSLLQRARATIYAKGKTYFLEPQEVSQ